MTEIDERSWKPRATAFNLTASKAGIYEIISGYVVTGRGVVGVYQGFLYLSLDFVWGGRHRRRRIKKIYTKQYIVTLAKRFAEEMSHE